MFEVQTIDALESTVTYAGPVIGGLLALRLGTHAQSPTGALAKTVALTVLFSVLFALAVGLAIDASLSNQQWKHWDGLWMPLSMLPIGGFVGIVFGAVAMKLVEARVLRELAQSESPRRSDA